MTLENKNRFSVISNEKVQITKEPEQNLEYQSNPFYEKLLNFRNLQNEQKKKFSVDDLFKLC